MAVNWHKLTDDRVRLAIAVAWVGVAVAVVFAYWPGLEGPFLLDDMGSIKALGDYGGVVDWESFKIFVFGGNAGPTGRPLSLLSFLIDGNNWPTDAWPFKRTNVVIHIINGVLLGILVTQVLKCLGRSNRDARWIALVTAAIWLLHPFLVSTTLYVVQRMAQLSTMFMFAGLALYLYGRSLLPANSKKAYIVMSVAVGGFTVLAMLAKENGILLPVLVGVIELTIMASQRDRVPGLHRYWTMIFIIVPTVVIFLYLGERLTRDDFLEIIPFRDFSIYERLLTQGRILIDYLQHWYLPKLYTTGVFQDHFIKSTGLFSPVTTALSFAFHAIVLAIAFARRRQWPLLSLAVLFFYASHLLESTVLNLELYFEHRNYGAAAFLFLPIVDSLYRRISARAFIVTSLAALLLVGSFTRYSSTVWQSLPSMAESSALKAPTSARAQSVYAKLLFSFQRYDEAIATIERAIENLPKADPLLLVNRLYFLCNRNLLIQHDFEVAARDLTQVPFDSRMLKAYNEFAQEVVKGSCPNIKIKAVTDMFERMLDLPSNADPTSLQYSHIQFLIGYSLMYAGDPNAALGAFYKSLDARPGPTHAMAMAALMASSSYFEEALALAERALRQLDKELTESPRKLQEVTVSDINEFRATVMEDLARQRGDGTEN
jgi:tetratricopeptide (TPR) repeat protein